MKLENLFFIVFLLGVLIIVSFQVYQSVYSVDKDFNKQVENHLISTVQIKGERINDYFFERKHDVLVLADSKEVKELLSSKDNSSKDDSSKDDSGEPKGEISSKVSVIEKNIEEELEVIVNQIEIFVKKYPDMSFSDLQNDEEFQRIVSRKIGKTGHASLADYTSFNKTEFDYYKQANVKTSDGISLGIVAKVNLDEFKILSNVSDDLKNYMKRFKEISNYENLILIDSKGYVVLEVVEGFELGTNLKFDAYSNTSLGKAYSGINNLEEVTVYGPYLEIGNPTLVLLFMTKVYLGEEFIGIIVLQDSMEDVNKISTEPTGLGETGDSYIVDKKGFLITPSRQRDIDLLVQEVESENFKNCFNKSFEKLTSSFENYKGDEVLGTSFDIEEFDWCLLAEIEEQEVFKTPKQGKIKQDLIFIFILNFILLIIVFVLRKKLNFFGKER